MQDAPLPGTPPPPARRGLERSTSFLVVAIVAAVGMGIVWWIGRTENAPSRAPREERRGAGARAEAAVVSAFEELLRLKDDAFDTHNSSLLDDVYAENSPAGDRAEAGIKELRKEGVFDHGRRETVSVTVNHLSRTEAVIKHVVTYYPCFKDSRGNDITQSPGVIEQETLYELRWERGAWRIWDVQLQEDRVILKEMSSCARA